ncbi:FAD-dependent oxidoreductase [Rhodoluna sp.]|uniref:NAD(P)/FAD-dependent oxidoreductase n=1 Tax=Rhodoluna sp. TaxID=1969481 RepID=UPI0025CD8819|nr:FAD-dependent oxidoreductase [Rhodoluna sp.]
MTNKILIIGAGQAGMQIADSLREEGFTGSITMIGDESQLPYQRPPLSKAFLYGEADEESLEFRNQKFYADNNIELVLGDAVVNISTTENGGVATTASGKTIEFDRMALTPGSVPRKLEIAGSDLDGVLYMRSLADARKLKERWEAAKNVVVIGGGFIGLEVAAVATKAGKNVTVLEGADRMMARAVCPFTSEYFKNAHERRGAKITLNARISHFEGANGKVSGVALEDGSVIPAEIVMVGIGVLARTEVANLLGLELANGAILVDEFAQTSNPLVVAAGDAVMLPNPTGSEGLVRLESVQNAVDQAHVAAKTLLGKRESYHALPWFWSDQADIKLQIAGLSTGYDQTVVRGNPDEDSFSVLYYKNGRLIAVDAVNHVSDYMAVRKCLTNAQTIPADAAADSSVALKTLVTA